MLNAWCVWQSSPPPPLRKYMWKVPDIFTLCAVLSTFAHAEPFLPSFHMHAMESYWKCMESWAGLRTRWLVDVFLTTFTSREQSQTNVVPLLQTYTTSSQRLVSSPDPPPSPCNPPRDLFGYQTSHWLTLETIWVPTLKVNFCIHVATVVQLAA